MVLVAALAAQPAEAGVGGCFWGVGGCKLEAKVPVNANPAVLDHLRGALRADMIETLKAILESGKKGAQVRQGGSQTSDGVGGCFWGVGGCKL